MVGNSLVKFIQIAIEPDSIYALDDEGRVWRWGYKVPEDGEVPETVPRWRRIPGDDDRSLDGESR